MITEINHLTLTISNLERSFHFYREILGFTPLMKHARGAYFLAGRTWFCIELGELTPKPLCSDDTHVAFGVDQENFPTLSQRILAAGCAIWKQNRSEGDSLYFLDPDGNKLEIHVGNWETRLKAAQAKPWNDSLEFFPPPQNKPSLTLALEPKSLAITRLSANAPIPPWASQGAFSSITRTEDEISIVCDDAQTPGTQEKCERPWRALRVQGPLDFALTGILAGLAGALAQAGIPIFAISTFDTDYILVKADKLEAASLCLKAAGHVVRT